VTIEDELRSVQTFAALKPSYKVLIYLSAKLTATSLSALSAEIIACKYVLVGLTKSPIQQRQLIAAIEWFCGVRNASLIKFFPALLKVFFDEELIEEDVFLEWAADHAKNDYTINSITDAVLERLRELSHPFIVWLQEAEEEEEEEDEDED
jgi:translation initiation factor 5